MKVPELLAEPWAIAPPAYEALVQCARTGGGMLEAKAAAVGAAPEALIRLIDSGPPEEELDIRGDRVAVIPVRGYLTRRPYWRGDRAAYEWIGARIQDALDSHSVRRIVLEVDSRGGQVNGTEELASFIREARQQKPITSVVLGEASSAAYWIASAASRVMLGRTSMMGSIGVIWTWIDWSKYDAELGIQEISIVSSQSPDKAIDPATEHGRSRVQATVDQLAGVFVGDVAANRGVDESKVISDFGRGWVLVGQEAVDAGMADVVGTFDEAITEPDEEASSSSTMPAASGREGPMKTVNVSDITAAFLEEHCPEVFQALQGAAREGYVVVADHEAAVTAARSESTQEAVEAAVTAERERVVGILSATKGTGLGSLGLKMVNEPGTTVDAAKARLFEAQQAKRQGQLDALREDEATLDAPDPDDGGGDETTQAASLIKASTDYVKRHHGIR